MTGTHFSSRERSPLEIWFFQCTGTSNADDDGSSRMRCTHRRNPNLGEAAFADDGDDDASFRRMANVSSSISVPSPLANGIQTYRAFSSESLSIPSTCRILSPLCRTATERGLRSPTTRRRRTIGTTHGRGKDASVCVPSSHITASSIHHILHV